MSSESAIFATVGQIADSPKKWVAFALLYIVLAPGLILSIPPTVNADKDSTVVTDTSFLYTGRVTPWNALVHALVFVLLYVFLKIKFPDWLP